MEHFPDNVRKVLSRLGLSASGAAPVLLPIPHGQKGPRFDAWQRVTAQDMANPAFEVSYSRSDPQDASKRIELRRMRYASLFASANIGVLQGEPSGGLCSIDIDEDRAAEEFLSLNPLLHGALRTRGSRGCNVWLWVTGEFPKLHKDLCWMGDDGKPDKGRPWGEWRSTGGQTVIFGRHPSGSDYQWLVDAEPGRVRFDQIVWPNGLHVPWGAKLIEAQAEAPAAGNAIKAELEAEFGPAWQSSAKGGDITLNQTFWAAALAKKHTLLASPEENRFYRYHAEQGLWKEETPQRLQWMLTDLMMAVAKDAKVQPLVFKRSNNNTSAVISLLRGYAERWEAFKRPIDPETGLPKFYIHVRNGMLRLDREELQLESFDPAYFSRNQLAVSLDEDARCPRFLGELLRPAIAEEDIELLQRWAGSLILGVNLPQKLMILTGTAGGGKTTLINVLAELIGRANVGQLRTEHLHERFEIFRLINRTFLYGTDVPGDFMQSDGAYVIKSLVGGDLMDAEPKNGNHCFQIKGEFNVGITCNTRLKVRLDGDTDAWRRRILIIPYEAPRPAHPDPLFVTRLLLSEASGVLNWAVLGAKTLLAELKDTGGMRLSARQQARIDALLAESDSVREFAKQAVQRAPGGKVTVEQLTHAYQDFCEQRGWIALQLKAVERQLPDILAELYRATRGNDIKGEEGKAKRGFRGIALVNDTVELTST